MSYDEAINQREDKIKNKLNMVGLVVGDSISEIAKTMSTIISLYKEQYVQLQLQYENAVDELAKKELELQQSLQRIEELEKYNVKEED